jgi:tetratricopeptide (TPR) repeat protein
LQHALDVRRAIVEGFPKEAAYLQAMARTCYDLGTVLARLPKQREAAENAYQEAARIQKDLCESQPDDANFQRDWARTLNNLGRLLQYDEGRGAEAEDAFRHAVGIHEQVAQKHPNVPLYGLLLARSYSNLASMRGLKDGEETHGKAIKLLRRLVADFPTVPIYRQELAGRYYNLGLFYQQAKRFGEADGAYNEALALRRQLVSESPKDPDYQHTLATLYLGVGRSLEERGQAQEGEKHYQQAIGVLEKLASAKDSKEYQSDLGKALEYRGLFLISRADLLRIIQGLELVLQSANGTPWYPGVLPEGQESLSQAQECFIRAISWQRTAWNADKKNATYPSFLYGHYKNLCVVQSMLKDHQGLAGSAGAFPEIYPEVRESYLQAAKALARAVTLVAADARLTESQRAETTEGYARAAIQMLRTAVNRRFFDPNELRTSPAFAPFRHRPDFQRLIREMEDVRPRNA